MFDDPQDLPYIPQEQEPESSPSAGSRAEEENPDDTRPDPQLETFPERTQSSPQAEARLQAAVQRIVANIFRRRRAAVRSPQEEDPPEQEDHVYVDVEQEDHHYVDVEQEQEDHHMNNVDVNNVDDVDNVEQPPSESSVKDLLQQLIEELLAEDPDALALVIYDPEAAAATLGDPVGPVAGPQDATGDQLPLAAGLVGPAAAGRGHGGGPRGRAGRGGKAGGRGRGRGVPGPGPYLGTWRRHGNIERRCEHIEFSASQRVASAKHHIIVDTATTHYKYTPGPLEPNGVVRVKRKRSITVTEMLLSNKRGSYETMRYMNEDLVKPLKPPMRS